MAPRRKLAANPRKHPEQDRSRATVGTILQAAAHVLVKRGYEAFTTNRVAEKAGVSIGSLYQYFPNKDALLVALMKRHVMEIENTVVEMVDRAATLPLQELVQLAVEQNVKSHLIEPELHRVLSEEVPSLGNLDWKKAYSRRVEARVRAAFETRRSEITVSDLDLAVFVVTRTVEAVVHNAVSERPHDLQSGALAAEVSRLIVGYLTSKPVPRKGVLRAAAE
ncbi:MAG: TetR/AcrR family transcriptional regulator [Micropepsaceae bacterium]